MFLSGIGENKPHSRANRITERDIEKATDILNDFIGEPKINNSTEYIKEYSGAKIQELYKESNYHSMTGTLGNS